MPAAMSTRDRLLDTAERLFAAEGVDRASLRRITAEAGVNLASVNYHFGSKLELVRAVFSRRVGPMNAERLALLDAVERAAGEGPAPLGAILHAFLAPALSLGSAEGREFFVLIARAHASPSDEMQRAFLGQFEEVAARFGGALSRALPDLEREELLWRLHFTVGALCHTVLNTHLLTMLSQGLCTADDENQVLTRLVDYAQAGLRSGQAS